MPPTGNRSGLASHHTRPTRACGTGTTIEEVDEHSSPHALTIMTTLRMTIPDTGSCPADFHPHPTITYTGPIPKQCDSKYIRLRALRLAMMYFNLFATNRGGSHATDSRLSNTCAPRESGRRHAQSDSRRVAPLGRNALSVMTIHSPAYTDPTTGSGDS